MTDFTTIIEQPQSISGVPGESGPVTVRIMTKEDVPFVADLSVEAFRGKTECAVGKSNVEKVKEILARVLLASPQWVYERNFVAFHNGERAGVCALKFHGDGSTPDPDVSDVGCCLLIRLGCIEHLAKEDVPQNAVYVDHICVDSAFRGKGIGKVLLDRADYEARKNNAKLIYLAVTKDNRAQNLYTRHGYQIVGDMGGGCISYCVVGVKSYYKMTKPLV